MEDLSKWIAIGKRVGLNISKFRSIKRVIYHNLELIQQTLHRLHEQCTLKHGSGQEHSLHLAKCYENLERAYSKQSEYIVLTSLRIIIEKVQSIPLRTKRRASRNNLTECCYILIEELENHLEKPYSELVRLGLNEVNLVLSTLRNDGGTDIY